MKISLTQEKLARGLSIVSRVVGSRASLPILANILLTAEDGVLTLSATNLEIALRVTIPCKIDQPGSVTVPAKLLSEVIQGVASEKVQLTSDGDSLNISAAHVQASLQGMAVDEFPAIPQVNSAQTTELPAMEIKNLLERVARAASLDESRPVLAGVYLNSQNSQLILVATDSYRLAEEKITLKDVADFSVIIPIRTVQEVIRLINPDQEDSFQLSVGESEIKIVVGEVELVSRLIEGNFPNYQQIIPTASQTTITCRRDELAAITRLSSVFARESAHTVQIDIDKDLLKVYAEAAQVGKNTSELPIELKGQPTQISLNARFLLDALSAFSEPEVEITLNDKLEPCVIRPVDGPNHSLHLIMPLRS